MTSDLLKRGAGKASRMGDGKGSTSKEVPL